MPQPNQYTSPPLAERFWSKVEKTENCWIWKATRIPTGYGLFRFNGKSHIASRVAYELTHGSIPDGLLVCHTCDNRRCVNPKHLFLGDLLANKHDSMVKGRDFNPANYTRDHPEHQSIAGKQRAKAFTHEYQVEASKMAQLKRKNSGWVG